ncbi:MAG: DUF5011 domain-containing protein, partial [Bacillota bacterium]|nr:DUF5011 domain-containing protein [Bacillota bacterium]
MKKMRKRLSLVVSFIFIFQLITLNLNLNVKASADQRITFAYGDFSNSLDNGLLTLGNNASYNNNEIQLTPASTNQEGSAFFQKRISVAKNASFSSFFVMKFNQNGGYTDPSKNPGGGADGIVFVINTQQNTIGKVGGGIGFGGINNSVGIEFDTFKNPNSADAVTGEYINDPDYNHVGIDINGSTVSKATQNLGSLNLKSGNPIYSWVDYNGSTNTLEVRVSNSSIRPAAATLSYNIDLSATLQSNDVYVGFTSGTGGAYSRQAILSWYFDNKYNPIDTTNNSYAFAPQTVTISATPSTSASELNNITVHVENVDGSDAAGIPVALSTSLGLLQDTTVITDANGNATTVLNANEAVGTANIEAVAEGGAYADTTVNFTADTGKPVIALNGDNPITMQVGSIYNDAGAKAYDSYEGDITNRVISTGSVDTTKVGTYTITYNASDTAGNTADPVTRTVNIIDTGKPVITLNEDNPVTVTVGSTYTDAGAKAYDTYYGDITSSIVTTGSVDTTKIGTYTITYNANDLSGNTADTVTRTINVVDNVKPIITLTGNSTETLPAGSSYTDAGATATDNYDGDITSNIVTTSNVDTNKPGTYTVTYNVTDSSGNIADTVTRIVKVVDTTKPILSLKGNAEDTIEVNTVDSYKDPGFTAIDAIDGDITGSVQVSGTVDTRKVGDYTLTYTSTDEAGNTATLTRIVHVVDTTKPVISVTGDSPLTVAVKNAFNDPGATAMDNYDGDISNMITAISNVDTNKLGTYTVTYNVSDSHENIADTVTRTVNVVDNVKPVIILNGLPTEVIEANSSYIDQGAVALDNYYGDVTNDIVTTSNVDTNKPGTYTVTYNVTDSSGNIADTVTRTVKVVDSTKPILSLKGNAEETIEVNTPFVDPGFTASDNVDGNITGSVTTAGSV